ncbi:isoquinoline 1-oxidoreductase subunit beta [uncultured Gammaproteobacteria bacterium]
MSGVVNLSRSRLSRRKLLQTGAGAAAATLVLGFHLSSGESGAALAAEPAITGTAINAWLRLSAEEITILVPAAEMGQGVFTALPMLVAEELDCDWRQVRAQAAPLAGVYANPLFGQMATGGSTSVRAWFLPLRKVGAAARLMLIGAAARLWRTPSAELITEAGFVIHPLTGRRASYGALAGHAGRQTAPTDPPLKARGAWRLLGKATARLDLPAKVAGSAIYGADIRLAGMVFAAMCQCPVFGGTLVKIDNAEEVKALPGVVAVVPLTDAVAVVADSTWRAQSALTRLRISWAEGANGTNSEATITAALHQALAKPGAVAPGTVASVRGDVDTALHKAAWTMEADYSLPLLAHATMEPMVCTAVVTTNNCEIWAPTQSQSLHAKVLSGLLGLKPEQIKVNTTFLGGGFGRRFEVDVSVQAALVAKAVGRPVQVVWSREEDLRHDFYRPTSLSRVAVAVDDKGRLTGWRQRIAAPSIMARVAAQAARDGAIDATAVEGIFDQPYAIPNQRVEYIRCEVGVPVGFWRSVGHSINAFVLEGMVDEVARTVGRDGLSFRKSLLIGQPRWLRALDAVAAKIGWAVPLTPQPGIRRGRGIAIHESFGSLVAEAAEVSVFADGRVRVERVAAAIDCGPVVNPDTVDAQVRGAILFGLSAALYGKISIERGRVVQGNFDDYRLVTMAECPKIAVEILASDAPMGGVGEPATPPIAPAVVNAIFDATGKRLRSLPIAEHDLRD